MRILFVSLYSIIIISSSQIANAQTETAEYSLTFTAEWSSQTHPSIFPGNPHFSGLIGGTHNESVRFWMDGDVASDGIKTMAESGGKSPLDREVRDAITAGSAESVISGGGIGTSPGEVKINSFTVSKEFPLVTVVSMIAPSPDWFIGVDALSLLADGNWISELKVDLQPWDAGTDSGQSYTSSNQATNPRETIFQITGTPFIVGGTVPRLGVLKFERIDQPVSVDDWELY